jgi:serine/threonine protein phosphatase PrpC
MVADENVEEILLKEKDLNVAVYGLIEAANNAGGRDNVTAVVIKVVDRGMPSQPSASAAGS